MKAMVLHETVDFSKNRTPLVLEEWPIPEPKEKEVCIRVLACGVCHTELDEIEGRTSPSFFPIILGHQVVGKVVTLGRNAVRFKEGDRVGVGWIFSSCGTCTYCQNENENLCREFRATGKDAHGGYGEYMIVPEDFAHPIPNGFTDTEAAPLLCAGAVGYRALHLTGLQDGEILGLTGFGASGHLVLQTAKYLFPNSLFFVFARNPIERELALQLGAHWAGDTADTPPELLDAIIDTTPVWKPAVEALKTLRPGGRLVINAIRKENLDKESLLNMEYATHLWMEKEIKSVANVTRIDISEFLEIASKVPIKPQVQEFPLEEANTALWELKSGIIRGAKVLRIGE